jgi:hypothetical protein
VIYRIHTCLHQAIGYISCTSELTLGSCVNISGSLHCHILICRPDKSGTTFWCCCSTLCVVPSLVNCLCMFGYHEAYSLSPLPNALCALIGRSRNRQLELGAPLGWFAQTAYETPHSNVSHVFESGIGMLPGIVMLP